jgi:hypothetical protein
MIGGKNRIKGLVNKKDTFQETTNGTEGIWQRPKKGKRSGGGYRTTGQSGLKLFVAYESTFTYKPRFDFYSISARSIKKNIAVEMQRAVSRAIQSAR